MNKTLLLLCGGICMLTGMNDVLAQNNTAAVVGTPDSANTMIIEETYGVISAPTETQAPAMNDDLQPLPGDPGVEVGPLPSSDMTQPQTPAVDTPVSVEVQETIESVN